MNRKEVRSGSAPADSDNESGVTGKTVREVVSPMGAVQSDGATVHQLLNVEYTYGEGPYANDYAGTLDSVSDAMSRVRGDARWNRCVPGNA